MYVLVSDSLYFARQKKLFLNPKKKKGDALDKICYYRLKKCLQKLCLWRKVCDGDKSGVALLAGEW